MAAAKNTAKPVAVATPATAPKAAEAPVAEVKAEKTVAAKKETAKKAPAKKAAAPKKETVKKETVKKEAVKKETAKKAPAKKATSKKAELKSEVQIQFAGKSYTQDDLVKIAKDVWQYDLGQKAADLNSLELYVKPEEQTAYYVMNKDFTGSFAI